MAVDSLRLNELVADVVGRQNASLKIARVLLLDEEPRKLTMPFTNRTEQDDASPVWYVSKKKKHSPRSLGSMRKLSQRLESPILAPLHRD